MFHRVLSTAASGFDRMVTAAVTARSRNERRQSRSESLGHAERMRWLDVIAETHAPGGVVPDAQVFFPASTPETVQKRFVRSLGARGRVFDWSWKSAAKPLNPDVAEKYLAVQPNHTAAARLFLHDDRPRPTVMLVHGYLGGRHAFEERLWPIAWMFERGLDVALFVLPFHGLRSDLAQRGAPMFPGSDPRITIEGFRQAIIDLRGLSRLIRARGASDVGVMGMSLGGYTTSLLATVEDTLAFAVPVIPLASIADFARDHERLVGTGDEKILQHAALERSMRVVSPLARVPVVSGDRMVIIAGEGDRITPIGQARRLAAHFAAPIETFHGGHLLQFGRAQSFRAVGKMLGRLGLFEPRT